MTSFAVTGSRPVRSGSARRTSLRRTMIRRTMFRRTMFRRTMFRRTVFRRTVFRGAITVGLIATTLGLTPGRAEAINIESLPAAAASAATAVNSVTPSSATVTSGTSPEITASVFRLAVIEVVVQTAITKLGTPYSYGAGGPSAFDCSGFTRWAWAQMGVALPHNSGAQWAQVEHIDIADLQPGDLVFNWDAGERSPGHVGLYIGDGTMIHSPNGGSQVRFDPITWWTGSTLGAGRVL
jgi:cell wall-associated NlpC family hydrolase